MKIRFRSRSGARLRSLTVLVAVCALAAACSSADRSASFSDPYEGQNRAVFAENAAIAAMAPDRAGTGGGGAVPAAATGAAARFSANLALPGDIVNNLLQARPDAAVRNTFRFLVNSTLGLGGLFDPAAQDFGLRPDPTDFGETLYVWGAPEGAYLVLPVLGPTTERDVAGRVVDVFLDPLGAHLPDRVRYLGYGARLAARIGAEPPEPQVAVPAGLDAYERARLLHLIERRRDLVAGRAAPALR